MSVDKLLAILLYKDTVTTVMVENTIYHLVNVQFPWLGPGGNVWEKLLKAEVLDSIKNMVINIHVSGSDRMSDSVQSEEQK